MKKLLAVLVLVLLGTVAFAQWSTNGTNVYYNGGNVGIGTSTPAANFVVAGTAAQAVFYVERGVPAATPGISAIAQYRMRNPTTGDFFNFSFRQSSGSHQVIQSAYDASVAQFREFSFFDWSTRKYEIRGGVAVTEFLNQGNILFNNVGSIGIGMGTTALPSGAKVAIAGKVVCKEIEVTLAGLPDFVFNKDYKLMSLYDVENFINTNKHLPGVPSEAEVVANGLNLGDMNATLLQKVEELTLYMINLQKENDALKVRISNLEK